MVVGKVQDRIKKMKEAIDTEARQRANYIVEKAEEESNIERANLIKDEKQKIDEQFSKLLKAEKVKAKIEKSSVINRQRIRKMEVRYQLVQKLRKELKTKLKQITNDSTQYKELIEEFIVQGMLRMMEKNVSVEGPKDHKDLIQSTFTNCQEKFSKIIQEETGKQMKSTLALSEYSLEDKQKNIIGGIFLRSLDGLIVCDNSIDARVDLIFEHLLPAIRSMLFHRQ